MTKMETKVDAVLFELKRLRIKNNKKTFKKHNTYASSTSSEGVLSDSFSGSEANTKTKPPYKGKVHHKHEFPYCNGTNIRVWVGKVDRYFKITKTSKK